MKSKNITQNRRQFLKATGAVAASVILKPYQALSQDSSSPQAQAFSEAEAINRITGNFTLNQFPLAGAIVDVRNRTFPFIRTLEYQQQEGLSVLTDKEGLFGLAEGISTIYFPQNLDPSAFDRLVAQSGISPEFAQNLKSQTNPRFLDLLAQLSEQDLKFLETYGTKFVSYPNSNGQLMVTGSLESLVEVKQEGKRTKPVNQNRPIRDFLKALGSVLTGQGFPSANYTQEDVNRLSQASVRFIQGASQLSMPCNPTVQHSQVISMTAGDTCNTVLKYGNFPQNQLDVFWLDSNSQIKAFNLNLTGPQNRNAFPITLLEGLIDGVNGTRRNRLIIGSQDRNLISSQSGNNELSTRSGILGTDSISTVDNNNFLVYVRKKTGVNRGFREYADYEVTVAFGQESLKMVQNARDRVFFLRGLENAGIGFAFGGPWGAAIMGAKTIFDGVWAYFEGRNPPGSSLYIDDRQFVSRLKGSAKDVYSIFENSARLGANSLIVVPYQSDLCVTRKPSRESQLCYQVQVNQPGFVQTPCGALPFSEPGVYNIPQPCAPAVCSPAECLPPQSQVIVEPQQNYVTMPAVGLIYARDAYDVRMHGSCVRFNTTECGANHLLGLLYGGIMMASFNNPFKHHGTETATGGRNSAPGGNSYSQPSSGFRTSNPGGDSWGGASRGAGGNSYGGHY
jgi:hypothetical protein